MRLRLLLIDDDPLQRELLHHLLGSDGFGVTAEDSGSAALHRLRHSASPFDVILTDLQMPGTGGLELAPLLRALKSGAILLAMSARTATQNELQAFDSFLLKPFTVYDLRSAIEAISDTARTSAGDKSDAPPEKGTAFRRTMSSNSAPPSTPVEEPVGVVLDPRIFEQLKAAVGLPQLRQLYEMTVDDVDARLTRMRSHLVANDHSEVQREAHAIKGSCSMVGARELSHLAARIEAGPETDCTELNRVQQACLRLRHVVTIVPP